MYIVYLHYVSNTYCFLVSIDVPSREENLNFNSFSSVLNSIGTVLKLVTLELKYFSPNTFVNY